jgi:hypothetical protein
LQAKPLDELKEPVKSGKLPMALQTREFNTLVDCSKRLTAGRPVKASFRERKVALCDVPEANGFGTYAMDNWQLRLRWRVNTSRPQMPQQPDEPTVICVPMNARGMPEWGGW